MQSTDCAVGQFGQLRESAHVRRRTSSVSSIPRELRRQGWWGRRGVEKTNNPARGGSVLCFLRSLPSLCSDGARPIELLTVKSEDIDQDKMKWKGNGDRGNT
jgi:hypothetical protein